MKPLLPAGSGGIPVISQIIALPGLLLGSIGDGLSAFFHYREERARIAVQLEAFRSRIALEYHRIELIYQTTIRRIDAWRDALRGTVQLCSDRLKDEHEVILAITQHIGELVGILTSPDHTLREKRLAIAGLSILSQMRSEHLDKTDLLAGRILEAGRAVLIEYTTSSLGDPERKEVT